MALQAFEKRLERLVEGVFSRAFRSHLRPVEVGRRILREMDSVATLGVRGERVAPNHFSVRLAPDDGERFSSFIDTLLAELRDAVDEHAIAEEYELKGPTVVELTADPLLGTGRFEVRAQIQPGHRPSAPSLWLRLPDGSRIALEEGSPISVGRLPECDVVVSDTNVSRRHAEIRLVDGQAIVVDLGSLNGTKVNGRGIGPNPQGRVLIEGDEVRVGNSVMRLERIRPGARNDGARPGGLPA